MTVFVMTAAEDALAGHCCVLFGDPHKRQSRERVSAFAYGFCSYLKTGFLEPILYFLLETVMR